MPEIERVVKPSKAQLSDAIAERFVARVKDAIDARGEAHVVLTGGSMGTAFLEAVGRLEPDAVTWRQVHLWWGDERFVPAGDKERNDAQADDALLGRVPLDPAKVHRVDAGDERGDLEAAARAYAIELKAASGGHPSGVPTFDVVMLGMGPDTHVASLFPGRDETEVDDVTTVAVENSPKPPPRRVSLTFPALNRGRELWLMVAGADKAEGVKLASASSDRTAHPASGVRGLESTIWWLDEAAASML